MGEVMLELLRGALIAGRFGPPWNKGILLRVPPAPSSHVCLLEAEP